jgi:hypothetical protein
MLVKSGKYLHNGMIYVYVCMHHQMPFFSRQVLTWGGELLEFFDSSVILKIFTSNGKTIYNYQLSCTLSVQFLNLSSFQIVLFRKVNHKDVFFFILCKYVSCDVPLATTERKTMYYIYVSNVYVLELFEFSNIVQNRSLLILMGVKCYSILTEMFVNTTDMVLFFSAS